MRSKTQFLLILNLRAVAQSTLIQPTLRQIPAFQRSTFLLSRHKHSMASNTAAWLVSEKARPFEIKPAPLATPSDNQILIKNHAVAINPIDGKLQALAFYPIPYPTILGQDVAGEVVSVGSGVTRFKVGDRVIGNAAGFGTKKDTDRAFQAYTILQDNMASPIPSSVSYEQAVVLPLAISTAASGLFNPDFLHLRIPTIPPQKSTGEALLIWGGASSVGSCAIQLAVAAGYEVVTTASPKNFDYVTKLGASRVFDYKSPTIVADLLDVFKGKHLVGTFDAVGGAAWTPIIEVMHKSANANKFIATTIPRFPDTPEGVIMKQTQALSIMGNHVSKAIWEDFLPKALEVGTVVPAPEPLVVGHGLEKIQDAVDVQMKGTSAQKVVVTL